MAMQRRAILMTSAAASLAVFTIAAVSVTQSYHTVTVKADGAAEEVSGFNTDVGDVLDVAGVTLGEHDRVEPAIDTALAGVDSIEIFRAQPFTVHTAAGATTAWSSAVTLDAVFDDVSLPADATRITVSRNQTRGALPVTDTPREVTIEVDGAPTSVPVEGGETVGEILRAANVKTGPLDSLFVIPGDTGTQIQLITETREVITKTTDIAFETEYVEDPEEMEGTESVTQDGQAGQRTIRTYRQVVAGKELLNVKLSDEVTKKPVNQVISVGTKVPEPVVAPSAPAAGSSSGTDVSGVQVTNGDVWAALAQCESGGNPSANTGNGYYGMYQFSLSTWQSVGGSGLPSDASAAEQTQRAQLLQQRSGWGQWPACSASLGLF